MLFSASIKKSQDITKETVDETQLLNKDREKLSFYQYFTDTIKLRSLQHKFYQQPNNLKARYQYLRELNRQNKFQVALNVYQNMKPLYSKDNNEMEYILKAKNQYDYAKQELLKIPAFQQLMNSQKQNRSENRASFLELCLLIVYILYFSWRIYESMNEGEVVSDSEPKSNSGLLSTVFGKFVQNDGETNIKTRFSDVLGIDEFKDELVEIVDYLKNPKKYTEAGAKIPKGILLVGQPGTGKTLLARALAGESNCAFFYKSGSEFNEVFVGVGAKRVRELFKKARQKAPAIIFIDEIDSVAGNRSAVETNHSKDTINQILTEMDGFKQTDNIIVIGATNFSEALDPAIKRPGRFDKTLHVPLPDVKGREEIFQHYLSKIKTDKDVNKSILARQTTGFTGADIQNMVNLAILNAVKNGMEYSTSQDFEFAYDRITMGIGRKNMFVSEQDKFITAYHEGGHALTSLLTEGAMPLHKVTILPRGGALGFTAMIPEMDQLNMNKKSIMASIDVAMGGRAAEELILGNSEITTGSGNDLQKATEMAYHYVRGMGMSEKTSLISSDKKHTSDNHNYLIDQEVQKLLESSYTRVKQLLTTNSQNLKMVAQELIAKETISADEIRQLIGLKAKPQT